MKSINKVFYFLIALSLFQACNDPIVIGTDILDGDLSTLKSATIDVDVKTVTEDSVLVYSNTGIPKLLDHYALGNIEDPIFGKMNADIFGQLSLPANYIAPNFENATLDSVVLRLALDKQDFMKDSTVMNNVQIFELTEQISDDLERAYSNQSFSFDSKVIGEASFHNDMDSVTIYNVNIEGEIDTLTLAPHISITLDASFAEKLMAIDSVTYTDNQKFKDIIYGLHIASKDENGNLTKLNFKTINSRLSLYYSKEGAHKQFNYLFGAVIEHLDYDYTGSDCEKSINGDPQYAYLQGLSGTNIEINLPKLDTFNNVIINKAVLEFYVADVEDPFGFLPNEQLMLTYKKDDGSFAFIEDAAFAVNRGDYKFFGGQFNEKGGIKQYQLNISAYLQSAIQGDVSSTIYLRAFPKPTDLRRVILFGTDHTTYSPKIRITYTQL